VPVTATEPVFGHMSDAIGLDMRNQRFQLATMNDTEASARTLPRSRTTCASGRCAC
jgi:zinc/manganese transport system substrate-binding protein